MKIVTKKFLSDAGHGWLSVKRKELRDLGIEDKISPYSYQRGKSVYLEEDCDAPLYIKAMENVFGVKVELKFGKQQKTSPVRSYEGYKR